MKKKIQITGIIAGGLLLAAAIILVQAKVAGSGSSSVKNADIPELSEKNSAKQGISYSGADPAFQSMMNMEPSNERKQNENRESDFAPFEVVDNGAALPDNQIYTGLTCSIKDSRTETISLRFPDGRIREEEVSTMNLNNIWLSVPTGGSRSFGVPIFSTEYYAEGEWEQKQEWHDVEGIDCPEFNEGMEEARRLIREGYLQEDLENFLQRFPEIDPAKREYTLCLTGGGRTDRESDDTSWWELDYVLYTTADNGEVVPVITLDINKIIKAQGYEALDDARCRIWTAESGYWRLLEDASTDLGKIWISQVPEEDFSEEENTRSYVEKMGADFDCLLPSGAARQITWECSEGKFGWYNYLIWMGSTDTYDITLAIPLMEPESGGWYLASRIKKEAVQKETCRDTLLTMMQTFHLEDATYAVREGDTLWEIYTRYMKEEEYGLKEFAEYNGMKNPNLIWPGWRIRFPGR